MRFTHKTFDAGYDISTGNRTTWTRILFNGKPLTVLYTAFGGKLACEWLNSTVPADIDTMAACVNFILDNKQVKKDFYSMFKNL